MLLRVIISNDGPVIPFRVSQSNIRERLKKKYIKPEPTDELTTKALEALNSENVDVDMKPTLSNTEAIIVPPKEEEENIDDADYEQIPIEQFGLALLKGMGLKEEDLKNNSTSDDYAAKVRLKGLGLGADPEVLKRSREVARRSFDKDDERLSWKVGSKCQIIFGRHNGQYGSVEGLDGDIGRVVVKLAASKRIVKVMQATVRLVTKAEFEKYGNYLNMNEAKKFKENGDLLTELKESQVNIKGGHNDAKVEEFSAKRRKEDPSYRHELNESRRGSEGDLLSGTLIRKANIIFRRLRWYPFPCRPPVPSDAPVKRVVVEYYAVFIIVDVKEKYVQTTVPKRPGESLVVVRGPYVGEVGKLIERDDRSSQALVKIRFLKRNVQIDCDDICCFDRLN
ncbi:unnamed protein product [Hymenolepis diminuta]|uniref:KOW domain-containing protein n=1 Tax=Hymenolepis diminuta TaxID=6216 RepID=A0A158QE07_HYMDI|nr:unnamed protein product [Hymenolepis diminuta]